MSVYRAGFPPAFVFAIALTVCQVPSRLAAQTTGENPAYEVASVHLTNTNASRLLGFYSYPDGRVMWGAETVRDLLSYAFDIPPALIKGGPAWITDKRFDIQAKTPLRYRQSQSDLVVNPNEVQRLMLRNLLQERFGVSVRHSDRSRAVLMLGVKKPSPNLHPTSNPDHDPHGGIIVLVDGSVTGQAFGDNISMAFFAEELAERLEYPVVDETHLKGGYDFHLPGVESENHDMRRGIDLVLDRLGLTLRRGKWPVDTLFVQNVTLPTPN